MYGRLPALLALVMVGLVVPSLPARADSAVRLNTPFFVDLVVDDSHQLVFLSGGENTNAIEVRSFTGAFVAMIGGQDGASGMALSADGARLFVALPSRDAVSAINTSTLLEVGRWSTGPTSCPTNLAWAGGRLWVGYGCTPGNEGLAAIDPSSASPTLGESILATAVNPPGIVGSGNSLVAYDLDLPPNAFSFDVSTNPPIQLAQRNVGGQCHDASLSPNGDSVILACSSPQYHSVFRTSDLSADGVYPANAAPTAVASTADVVATGVYAGGSPDAYVFALDGALPLRTLAWAGGVPSGGLAFSADGSRLFAVTGQTDQTLTLHVVPNPTLPPLTTSLTMSTDKATYGYGAIATVKAHLGQTNDSRVVSIYATPYRGTKRLLKSASVDGSGNLSATYVVYGKTTFTVSFEGDDRYLPRSATSSVTSPARLTETMRRSYGKSGKYLLYKPKKNPLLLLSVSPRQQPGACVRYRVERRTAGAWQKVIRSGCFQLDANSQHAAVLNGQHVVGSKYRMRAELRANGYNLETLGSWQHLRFR